MFASIDTSKYPIVHITHGRHCTDTAQYKTYMKTFDSLLLAGDGQFVIIMNFIPIQHMSSSLFFSTLKWLHRRDISRISRIYFVTNSRMARTVSSYSPIKKFKIVSSVSKGVVMAREFIS